MSSTTPQQLNRLDKLIDQTADQQLTITQQGVSISDITDRIKNLENSVHTELQSIWPLKDIDVPRELIATKASIDKLQRQLTESTRQQEEITTQQQAQIDQLTQRHTQTDLRIDQLTQRIEEALAQQAEAVEDVRQYTKSTLSEVVSRIADQFDAIQTSLDTAITTKETEHIQRQKETASLKNDILTVQHQLLTELKVQQGAINVTTEHQKQQAGVSEALHVELTRQSTEIQTLKESQTAAEARETSTSELMQEALTVWQQGLEEELTGLRVKFDEYKAYLKRLRKDVHDLQQDRGLQAEHLDGLKAQLGGTQQGMKALHREAAALLCELQGATGEALDMEAVYASP